MKRIILALTGLLAASLAAAAPLTTKPNISNTLAQCLLNVPVVGAAAGSSPVCDARGALGTAAFVNTGTSGATIGLLNAANTWSGVQSFAANQLLLAGVTGSTQCLQANSSGVVSGSGGTCGGSGAPGGSTTQLQYNNAGAFAGITGATTNGTAVTLVAPILGTPASVTLTNGTGLPIAGITGLGTGVGTALAVNVGSAGAPILFNGAGGTPSSITLTNGSGTAASLTAGNATNTAITDDTATNATMFPTWVTANTGNLPQKVTSTKLSFNPSTGLLSSTGFVGSGTRLTFTAPVPQVFQTAGSFTYTPMSCAVGTATWTEFEISAGGGGGAGSGTTPGAPSAGGLSSFAGRSCAGGAAGLSNGGAAAGGACTGTVTGDDFLTGGSGGPATTVANSAGGIGGSNPRGGPGSSAPQIAGSAAVPNTGAGGGGGGTTSTSLSGGGGGAGGWLRGVIANPSSGTVVIGSAGTAGTAGTGGSVGGSGGSGVARFVDHCN